MRLTDTFSQVNGLAYIDAEEDALMHVGHEMAKARNHLAALRNAMDELKDQGIYPAVPTESWETKTGGEKNYLYMLFRTGSNGQYQGPDGKRRLAIGRDPIKIEEARGLASRRARYEELAAMASRLEGWISRTHHAILNLEREAKSWPSVDLGIAGSALRGENVPGK